MTKNLLLLQLLFYRSQNARTGVLLLFFTNHLSDCFQTSHVAFIFYCASFKAIGDKIGPREKILKFFRHLVKISKNFKIFFSIFIFKSSLSCSVFHADSEYICFSWKNSLKTYYYYSYCFTGHKYQLSGVRLQYRKTDTCIVFLTCLLGRSLILSRNRCLLKSVFHRAGPYTYPM